MATHIRYIQNLRQSLFLDGINGLNPRQSRQSYQKLTFLNGKLDHPDWQFSNIEYCDDYQDQDQDDLIDYDDDDDSDTVNHPTVAYLTSKGWVSDFDLILC